MIIIITRDDAIRSWANSPHSGSGAWGSVYAIPKEFNQSQATNVLFQALHGLPVNEPICISGHGNDLEIGDERAGGTNWGWSVQTFVEMLANVNTRQAPILFSTCGERVSNFSARLAVALIQKRAQKGLWIYGYNRGLDVRAPYPKPDELSTIKDWTLQWTQVWW